MIRTEKKIGRPTSFAGAQDDLARVAADPFVAELRGQVVGGVLHHHDRRVHQDADRDRDAGERHDVGRDAEEVHQDEGDQHGQRQRDDDDQGAAEVRQDQEDRDRAMMISSFSVRVTVWIASLIRRVRS